MAERLAGTVSRRETPVRGRWGMRLVAGLGCGIFAIVLAVRGAPASRGEETVEADAGEELDGGVDLPTDRQQERLLDRASRLVADGSWSDAA